MATQAAALTVCQAGSGAPGQAAAGRDLALSGGLVVAGRPGVVTAAGTAADDHGSRLSGLGFQVPLSPYLASHSVSDFRVRRSAADSLGGPAR